MLYDDFLTSNSAILTIQPDIPESIIKEYFVSNFLTKRIEKKIPIKIIKQKILTEFQKSIKTSKNDLREVRLVESLDSISDHTIIYGDTLVFIDYENLVGVRIKHSKFVDSQKTIFELLWKAGKTY